MRNLEQSQHLEMLVQIAQLLTTLDLDDVLLQTINLTTDAVGAARGSFFLLDEQGRFLQRFIAARSYDPETKSIVSQRVLQSGLAGWVMANQQAALVEDTMADSRWIVLDGDSEPKDVRSALCVPFFVEGQLRGIMTLEHPQPGHFQPLHLRLVEAAANQVTSALRNAQLFDRAQTQQRQLEAVLNSITDVLLVVDREWRILMLNPAALEFFGMPNEAMDDVRNQRLDELAARLQNPFVARLIEGISAAVPEDGKRAFEVRDEQGQRDFTASVATIYRSGAIDSGYVIALHDITSLKDLNRLKTHMIQMASHDLKNPIGVLRGYLEVIRADIRAGTVPDMLFVDNMYKSVNRMESLVANLLDIQRAEDESPLRRDVIDPYELVQAVLDDMLPSASRQRQQIISDIQPNIGPIKGDFTRLREAMNNLVENAIKYTPEGGFITLTLSVEAERLNFAVKDTGYGIPADQQARIFQPYFRAQQQGTEHISGTGIGLSLVKEVIERHGGQVWFHSVERQGSTFGFWLPLLS